MATRVKNWEKLQHYKERKPAWVKLYRDLIDDRDFYALDGEAAKLLILIWLLASETDGWLPEPEEIAWRLRVEKSGVINNLATLKRVGFLVEEKKEKRSSGGKSGEKTGTDVVEVSEPNLPWNKHIEDPSEEENHASNVLASRYQDASNVLALARSREKRREEKEKEKSRGAQKAAPDHLSRLTRLIEEELHWAEIDPDLKRDVSVAKSMLAAGIPVERIEAALRGFGVRRRRGEFAKFADRPTMRIFWTKGTWSQFFNECERAWETRPPEATSIAEIIAQITA